MKCQNRSRLTVWKCDRVKLKANNHLRPRWKLNNCLCSLRLSFSLSPLTVTTHQEFHWFQTWVTPNPLPPPQEKKPSHSTSHFVSRLKSHSADCDQQVLFDLTWQDATNGSQIYGVLHPTHLLNLDIKCSRLRIRAPARTSESCRWRGVFRLSVFPEQKNLILVTYVH